MLDFPSSPTNGQKYPASPVAGVPTYTWDGEKWTTMTLPVSGGGSGGGGASVLVSDTPPAGAADNSLWFESDTGLLYIRVNDGSSSQWVIVPPGVSAASMNAVTYAPQLLTSAQQEQVRKNIFASPYEGIANNNLLINGGFESNVLGWTTGATTIQTVDCWIFNKSANPGVTIDWLAGGPPGYSKYLRMTVQTPLASVVAGDDISIYQNIEGLILQRLGWGTPQAMPVTISFWTAHTRPGLYGGMMSSVGSPNLYCAFSYTQNVSGVWEYKTVTIPPNTVNAPAYTTSSQSIIRFEMVVGQPGAPYVWSATSTSGPTGAINGAAATSDTFRLAGVSAIPGNEAPPQERSPLIIKPYADEIIRCQRYVRVHNALMISGYNNAGGIIYQWTPISPPMRVTPSFASIGGAVNYFNASAAQLVDASPNMVRLQATVTAAGSGNATYPLILLDSRM